MEKSQELQVQESSQSCNPVLTLGGRVSQGTTLTVLAVAGVGAGLVLGWDSLVALGLSSFVLALLPCAVMCAVGLCASRMGKSAQTATGTPPATPGPGVLGVHADATSGPNPPLPESRT
jgi:hypothetical protein